ncbi:hypothetical protein NSQ59_16005 [Margalitia sp. FSL K6-0131]|uniref:hypothetical protein n=1 Tax=Margalitia sp. FSL K6-0131 TaxID=2954604 RepID=UPI0030F8E3E7
MITVMLNGMVLMKSNFMEKDISLIKEIIHVFGVNQSLLYMGNQVKFFDRFKEHDKRSLN